MFLQGRALVWYTIVAAAHGIAGLLYLSLDIKIGPPTTAGATEGGNNMGSAASEFAALLGTLATDLNARGRMAATKPSSVKLGEQREASS